MRKINKFKYMSPDDHRVTTPTSRHYTYFGEKLPSVTTILGATQDYGKTIALSKWRQNLGEKKADEVRDNAAKRGTIMHRILEGFITGKHHVDLSDMGQEAGTMAQALIADGLPEALTEVWGTEMMLCYEGLYGGAADVIGIYNGRESILDFKQANKPKTPQMVKDHFVQAAAYAMAHNYMYKTKIQQGVILVSVEGGEIQRFISKDKEFQAFMWEFLKKLDRYHSI
jgi:genome maintenance exonuclease 1